MKKKEQKKNDVFSRAVFLVLGGAIKAGARILFGVDIKEDERVSEWKRSKKGMMMLSAHPSEMDAVVLLSECWPFSTRFVVGAQQLYRGIQGRTLSVLGAIPKKQFTADISAVKEMMRTVKDGKILGMMPEGRVSAAGTPSPVDISTAKLIKKLGCPVAVLVPFGTYFVKPPFDRRRIFKGKIGGTVTALFDEGEASQLSEADILEKLCGALNYNCFEDQKYRKALYGKPGDPVMKNAAKMLYRCPACGGLYTFSEKESGRFSCSRCGAGFVIADGVFFRSEMPGDALPESIADWNAFQLESERSFFEGADAVLEFNVIEKSMHLGIETDFKDAGSGVIRLDASGLSYDGSGVQLSISASSLTGVSADYTDGFIALYDGDMIRRFYFDDVRAVLRFVNSIKIIKENSDREE